MKRALSALLVAAGLELAADSARAQAVATPPSVVRYVQPAPAGYYYANGYYPIGGYYYPSYYNSGSYPVGGYYYPSYYTVGAYARTGYYRRGVYGRRVVRSYPRPTPYSYRR